MLIIMSNNNSSTVWSTRDIIHFSRVNTILRDLLYNAGTPVIAQLSYITLAARPSTTSGGPHC